MRKTPARNSEEFHSMRAIPGRSVIRQDSAVSIPVGIDGPVRNFEPATVKKMSTPSRESEEFHSMRAIPGHSVIRQDTCVPIPDSPARGVPTPQKKMSTPFRKSEDFESMRSVPSRSVIRSDSAVPIPVNSNDTTARKAVPARDSSFSAPDTPFASISTTSPRSPSPRRERRQSPSPNGQFSPEQTNLSQTHLPIRSRNPSPSGTIQLTPSERRCSCCSRLASQLDEFHRKPSPKKQTPPVSRAPSPAPYKVVSRDPSPAPASADRQRLVSAPPAETLLLSRSGLPPFSPIRDSQRDWDDFSFTERHSAPHSPQIEVKGLPDMNVSGTTIPLRARGVTNVSAHSTDEPERQTFTVRRNYTSDYPLPDDVQSPNRYHNGSVARAERHRSPNTTVNDLGESFESLYTDTPVHAPPPRHVIPMEPLLPARLRDPYTGFNSPEKGVWVPSSPLHGTSFNRTGCPYLTRSRTPSPSPARSQLSIVIDTPAKPTKNTAAASVTIVRPYVDNRDTDSISVATPSNKPARKSAPHYSSSGSVVNSSSSANVTDIPHTPAPVRAEVPAVPVVPSAGAQIDVNSRVQAHGNIQLLNMTQQPPPHASLYAQVPTQAHTMTQPQHAEQQVQYQIQQPTQQEYTQPAVQHLPPPQPVQQVYTQNQVVSSGTSVHTNNSGSVYGTPMPAQVFSPLTQTPSVAPQYVPQALHAPLSPVPVYPAQHVLYPPQQPQYSSQQSVQYAQPQYIQAPSQYMQAPPPQYAQYPAQYAHYGPPSYSSAPPHYAPPSPGYAHYPPSAPYPVQYVPVPVQYVPMPPSPVQYVYPIHAIDTWYTDIQRHS